MPGLDVLPACNACPQPLNDMCGAMRVTSASSIVPTVIRSRAVRIGAQRSVAKDAALVVTNTSYFIADTQLSESSILNGRDLVITDECDTLESILMGHIEVNISKRTAHELGLTPPKHRTAESKAVAEEGEWIEWLEDEAKPKVKAAIALHRKHKDASPKWMKGKVRLERLRDKLTTLTAELEAGNAVYDGYDKGDIIFRPVKVDLAAPKLLWGEISALAVHECDAVPR